MPILHPAPHMYNEKIKGQQMGVNILFFANGQPNCETKLTFIL